MSKNLKKRQLKLYNINEEELFNTCKLLTNC